LLLLLLERRRDAAIAYHKWDRWIADLMDDPELATAARRGGQMPESWNTGPAPPPRLIADNAAAAEALDGLRVIARRQQTKNGSPAHRAAAAERMKAMWATPTKRAKLVRAIKRAKRAKRTKPATT
jgi:hypothetical protein